MHLNARLKKSPAAPQERGSPERPFEKENVSQNLSRHLRKSQQGALRKSLKRGDGLGIKDKTFQEIMIKDDELLKQKSLAVRQYLNDNLMPELTEVIVEICKNKPADPVEFAIEYLSDKINLPEQ